jgi:hypothetical protein
MPSEREILARVADLIDGALWALEELDQGVDESEALRQALEEASALLSRYAWCPHVPALTPCPYGCDA